MKRTLLIVSALAVILIAGCNGNGSDSGTAATILDNISTETIAQEIFTEIEIPSSVQKGAEDLEFFFSGLTLEGIRELSYYICASGAFPDELLIIKFDTARQAADAKPAVQSRLESRRDDFRDYAPDEMYKLDSAEVRTNSNWLFFFVTENNARVSGIINSYVG
ncbi:MAG: DUF4358 domain-containing protein [Oscillospiraceae bacterium]|jgi:hypothetical protein|nr:DUF4358 domain-containing protein [Oscillospiraceae bacterium]